MAIDISAISQPYAPNPGIPESWHHGHLRSVARCRVPHRPGPGARRPRGCCDTWAACIACILNSSAGPLLDPQLDSADSQDHFAPKITWFGPEL